jgi:hypothetical protein
MEKKTELSTATGSFLFKQTPHPTDVDEAYHTFNQSNCLNAIYWQKFFDMVEDLAFDSVVECGVGRGRSLITIASLETLYATLGKRRHRHIYGLDSFEGFPDPTPEDDSPRRPKKGEWNFELMPVYFIAILDFIYDEKEEMQKFRRDVCLKDQDGEIFYDKFHFKFLQMPLFTKQEHELGTHFDKWVYFLKNLENFDHIPAILNEPIFQKGFEIAELSHLTARQYDAYLKSLVDYSEINNVKDTYFNDGKIERTLEIARALKENKVALNIIMATTGLTEAEIDKL